jgi:sugar lactone lactonase YvrE
MVSPTHPRLKEISMTPRSWIRQLFARPITRPIRKAPAWCRPTLEALEDRLAPAVQLTYGGLGAALGLRELVSGATPAVTVSEPASNQLRIDLGGQTFDSKSTAQATGLSYEHPGAPGASHFATVDISQANSIVAFGATLPGDALRIGVIADAAGGLGNVAVSAGVISVTGLDTAHAGAGNGNVDLRAAGALTVASDALLEPGTVKISLAAGVNADGTGSSTGGKLSIAHGATVVSDNADSDAITLRGSDVDIATGANPALVGAHRILSTTPTATLTGLDFPGALAFDAHGNLYVANVGNNTVSEFAPGRTTPSAILTGLDEPVSLAFDAQGNLYVANNGANSVGTTVSVFAPGSTTPTRTLTGLDNPYALAFDAHGNLYVGNSQTVSVFPPGSTSPTRTLTGLNNAAGMAFDAAGNLYVANIGFGSAGTTVSVFAPGSTTPTRTLTGLDEPLALAFDAHGNLFVANWGGSQGTTVSEFAPGSTTSTATLSGVYGPLDLAFDAHGNLYVTNDGNGQGTTVSEFAPGSTTPTRTLTGLNHPGALAFDATGDLFVANDNIVSVFTPRPAAGGVVIRTARPEQPISVGTDPGIGLALTNAEIAQVFATRTVTFGDPTQTGNITFTDTIVGAGVAAVQSSAGAGAVVLDSATSAALAVGSGNVQLSAGQGGIVATGADAHPSLASSGQVSLDTPGAIGSSGHRVLFDAADTPTVVTVGIASAPAGDVYLGGLGRLTLGDVRTANAPLDVTAAAGLTVAPHAQLETGTGKITLAAGVNPDGTGSSFTVQDHGFEQPDVSHEPNRLLYNPTIKPWMFSDSSGLIANGSGFGNPDAPEGTQAAFLQKKGSISQTVDLAAGTYAVSFWAAQRHGDHQTFQVVLDNKTVLDTFTPASTSYSPYATAGFTVAAGRHTIAFVGTNPDGGDNTAFIDLVNDGTLSIGSGATVMSDNAASDAITLRGSDVHIATGADPALVGAHRILSTTPTATLSDGLNAPRALAFDAQGNLYVTNLADLTVSVFGPDGSPKTTLTGLFDPSALEFDAQGNLYVANYDKGTVSVFAPGATSPTRTLTGLSAPDALAFDAQGNLYVANQGGTTVSVFAPGATSPTRTLTGLDGPIALAFDAQGNLFVANGNGTTVSEFTPNSTTPDVTLTGLNKPFALAVDAHSDLYVANKGGDSVSVFGPDGSHKAPLTGLSAPDALAFDAQGNLYVANAGNGTVSLFAPGSTTPSRTLTGLNFPRALAFDAHGTLFVANLNGETVSVFTHVLSPVAGGVVIRTAQPDQPISVGAASGTGVNLSNAELAQIFTTAGGTITFGDPAQTGNIIFADATPTTTPGTNVVANQAATGPGAIVLDSSTGTGLSAGNGNVQLSAGQGGIVATGDDINPSIASSGQVSLDSNGGVGTAADPVGFEAMATPTAVTVGTTRVPDGGVYLSGQGSLTLGDVQTTNLAPLVVSAGNLTVADTLSAGDTSLSAFTFNVDAGASVTAGNTLAVSADSLNLLGTLSASGISLSALTLTVGAGASVTAGAGNALAVRTDTLHLLGTLSAGKTGLVTVTPFSITRDIDLGGPGPATDLVLSDSALGQVTAGTLRVGDATAYLGNITVTGNVTRHAGYSTLSLQTTKGTINAARGATLAINNLALQAGSGIGTTARMALDVLHLAFASQKGPIQLSDASAVTLTAVDTLPASSIPGDVFSASKVGAVSTLLSGGGRISGQITYQGQALAEGATLTLADGHHYQISYQGGTSGHDVTLTRLADLTSVPPPSSPGGAPPTITAVPTAITAVGPLTVYAFGFGPGGVLDFFEVDSVGQVFTQGFSFFGPIGPVQFLSSSLHVATDMAMVTNNTVWAVEVGDNGELFLMDIYNPLVFFNPFVVNAILAAVGL